MHGAHVESADQWQASAPASPGASLDAAFQALHLMPSAPPALIKISYLTLAKIYHPDAGGNEEAMKRINNAFDVLKGRLAA